MSRYCPKCLKAKQICICEHIQPIDMQSEIILLQHMKEAKHPKGSAYILPLSFNHQAVKVHHFIGEVFEQEPAFHDLLQDTNYQHILLYPNQESQALEAFIARKQTRKAQTRLILIDGTWKKAYKIFQLNPSLHQFPSVHLADGITGEYQIRKAPSEQHLSTLEAAYYALTCLEPETKFEPLLESFQHMIAKQASFRPKT